MRHNYGSSCALEWARALQQQKPLQWEALVPQLEISPRLPQLEKVRPQQEDPARIASRKKSELGFLSPRFSINMLLTEI